MKILELPLKKEWYDMIDMYRAGNDKVKPVDMSLEDITQGMFGISKDAFMEKIGINPKVDTMQNIYSMPDQSIRWIVPEIIREA